MSIKESANQARLAQVGKILTDCKMHLEAFEVFGLGNIDHPVSGIATEVAHFHGVIESALKKHQEWERKRYADASADLKVQLDRVKQR